MADVWNGDVRIHYEVEGSGEPLVLQHGFMDSTETWRECGYVGALRSRYQLVLIDGRGHGASSKPHEPSDYAARLQAEDVVVVLDDLGIPAADFFGYSMGGLIGFALAKYAPARVRRYILGGWSPIGGMPQKTALEMWNGLKAGLPAAIGFWTAQGPISRELERRLLANDIVALRAYFKSGTVVPDPLDDVSATLEAPCLLIVGDGDWAHAGAIETAERLPNGDVLRVRGQNHLTTFQRSDLVLPHVMNFLEAEAR